MINNDRFPRDTTKRKLRDYEVGLAQRHYRRYLAWEAKKYYLRSLGYVVLMLVLMAAVWMGTRAAFDWVKAPLELRKAQDAIIWGEPPVCPKYQKTMSTADGPLHICDGGAKK